MAMNLLVQRGIELFASHSSRKENNGTEAPQPLTLQQQERSLVILNIVEWGQQQTQEFIASLSWARKDVTIPRILVSFVLGITKSAKCHSDFELGTRQA